MDDMVEFPVATLTRLLVEYETPPDPLKAMARLIVCPSLREEAVPFCSTVLTNAPWAIS